MTEVSDRLKRMPFHATRTCNSVSMAYGNGKRLAIVTSWRKTENECSADSRFSSPVRSGAFRWEGNNQLKIYKNLHFLIKSAVASDTILIFVYMQYNNVDSVIDSGFH